MIITKMHYYFSDFAWKNAIEKNQMKKDRFLFINIKRSAFIIIIIIIIIISLRKSST